MSHRITVERIRRVLRQTPRTASPLETAKRQAAVAVILHQQELAAEVLLIRRAQHPHDPWSGHMALPGGRREPDDCDLRHTAARETYEEVGIDLTRQAELIGELKPVEAVAQGRRMDMSITPFVFALKEMPEIRTNREVEEAVWARLGCLADGTTDDCFSYEHEGRRLRLPAWNLQGRVVWGLTHRMLTQLLELLQNEAPASSRLPATGGAASKRM